MHHGYQQVAVDLKAREFLGAWAEGKEVVSTVLPFGLNLSPYIFTRFTTWVTRKIREKFGLYSAVYVDDYLFGAESKEKLEEGIKKVRSLFETLGIKISSKTALIPQREVQFLGFNWNALTKEISVPTERRKEYRRRILNILRHPQTKKVWNKVTGRLLFLKQAVGPTMRRLRSIFKAANSRKKGLIQATGEAAEDLSWWAEKLRKPVTFPLREDQISGAIVTDASQEGIGVTLDIWDPKEGKSVSQTEEFRFQPTSGMHINGKELEALWKILNKRGEELKGKKLMWLTDNECARAMVAKQGSQVVGEDLWGLTKCITYFIWERSITLVPQRVPGRLNLLTDQLSRPKEEFSLWQRALAGLVKRLGPFQFDPCGAFGAVQSPLEKMEWLKGRSILLPRIDKIRELVDMLAQLQPVQPPPVPPIAWKQLTVIVTPEWRGATWWPTLKRLARGRVRLGRLPNDQLENWRVRNGRTSGWIASWMHLNLRN